MNSKKIKLIAMINFYEDVLNSLSIKEQNRLIANHTELLEFQCMKRMIPYNSTIDKIDTYLVTLMGAFCNTGHRNLL